MPFFIPRPTPVYMTPVAKHLVKATASKPAKKPPTQVPAVPLVVDGFDKSKAPIKTLSVKAPVSRGSDLSNQAEKLSAKIQNTVVFEKGLRDVLGEKTRELWLEKNLGLRVRDVEKQWADLKGQVNSSHPPSSLPNSLNVLDQSVQALAADISAVRQVAFKEALRYMTPRPTGWLRSYALLLAVFDRDPKKLQTLVDHFKPNPPDTAKKTDREIMQRFSAEILQNLKNMGLVQAFSDEQILGYKHEIDELIDINGALAKIEQDLNDAPPSFAVQDADTLRALREWREIKLRVKSKLLIKKEALLAKKAFVDSCHMATDGYYRVVDERRAFLADLSSVLPSACKYNGSKENVHQSLVESLSKRHLEFFSIMGNASQEAHEWSRVREGGHAGENGKYYRISDGKFDEILRAMLP